MEIVSFLIDLFLHLDEHLEIIIQNYGTLTYLFLFVVIFMETGLVVTPFLPGDSLLFAAGTFASPVMHQALNIWLLYGLLFAAAFLGDTANYWIGHNIGMRLFNSNNRFLKRVLKKEYLDKTHAFYEKHGGKTIIIARFVPIVRTFAPFVAGVGEMTYGHFISYNIIGGFLWVTLFLFGGYFFGNLPFVEQNFSLVVIAIILVSVLPAVFEIVRDRMRSRGVQGAAE